MAAKAPKTSVNGKLVKTQPVPKTGGYATRKLSRGELPPIYKCAMCGNVYAVATGIFYKSPNSVFAKNNDEYELGYWIGKPFWGQGLIPEASRELLRYAFEELGMRAVWCGYYDGNEKSRKVQTKLGFVYRYTSHGLSGKLLNEIRTGHCNLMTKERWQKVKLFCSQKKTLDTFREKNAISQAQYDKSLGDLRNLMEMYGVE